MNFIEEVNSYEDICKILSIDPTLKPDVSVYHERDKEAAVSNFRIWNANRAAWGDVEIDWNDYNQRKYEVWFYLNDEAGSGSGFSYDDYYYDGTFSYVGARLVWPSKEIGKHLVKVLEQDFKNVIKITKK